MPRKLILTFAFVSLAAGMAAGISQILWSNEQAYLAALLSKSAPAEALTFSEEELADLARPSVVRIYQAVTGQVKVPEFSVDISKREILIDAKKSRTIPIRYEFFGTGVAVQPNGYIATNAHIVSLDTAKFLKIKELISLAATKAAQTKPKPVKKATTTPPIIDPGVLASELFEKEYPRILEGSVFELSGSIVVFNPSSEGGSLAALLREGFEASVEYAESGFLENDRDIAIIKIERERLPALPIDPIEALPIARTVFTFDSSDVTSSSTEALGTKKLVKRQIRSIQNSDSGGFRLYELDQTIASSSSGGPVLDANGRMQGLATRLLAAEAGLAEREGAVVIPSSLLIDSMKKALIEPKTGVYYENMAAGIELLHQKRCKEALAKFDAARETNGAFQVTDTIKKYTDTCTGLIAAGESIDTRFDVAKNFITTMGPLLWTIIGLALLGALAVIVIAIFLRRRTKRREVQAINAAKKELEGSAPSEKTKNVDAVTRSPLVPKKEPAYAAFLTKREEKKTDVTHATAEIGAAQYVRDQLNAGFSEKEISQALAEAGWIEDAIRKIMLLSHIK